MKFQPGPPCPRTTDSRSHRTRLPTVAGAAILVIALAACSSTGNTPDTRSTGPTAGPANTPGATVAFVTHQAPGDTFWDLVRRGAEVAAAKDNIRLQYS